MIDTTNDDIPLSINNNIKPIIKKNNDNSNDNNNNNNNNGLPNNKGNKSNKRSPKKPQSQRDQGLSDKYSKISVVMRSKFFGASHVACR